MIYKSTQSYQVQFLPQAMPVEHADNSYQHSYDNSYEYNDTMTMLFPNSTRSNAPNSDQWTQIARDPFGHPDQYANSASNYQHRPLYGAYHTPDYNSPAHSASPPMLVPPPSESILQSPSPSAILPVPYAHSPGSFMSPPEHTSDAIRMSIYVKKVEGSQHHPVPLETSPFKK